MLSDERKALIEAEEKLRHEIKMKLEAEGQQIDLAASRLDGKMERAEKAFSEKLYAFLNSSIGLLLVSSLLVSGGGALYQQAQHQYEIEQLNKAKLTAYRFEIGDRIKNMQYLLRHAKTVGEARVALGSIFKSKFPLNSELDNKSLSSLYFNLYQLIGGTDREKSKAALELIRSLEDAEFSLQNQPSSSPLDLSEKQKINALVDRIEALHVDLYSKP